MKKKIGKEKSEKQKEKGSADEGGGGRSDIRECVC